MSKPKTAGGYIWRIKELEEENLELKAHVERLREEYEEAQCQWGNDYLWQKWKKDAVLEEIPIQSLAAHDREVAEKVRSFISHELNCDDEGFAPDDLVDMMDLDWVLKDES